MSFCTKCGTQMNAGGAFCNNCGAKQGVGFEVPSIKAVLQPPSRSMLTGFGAIVLIILLLQRMMSIPFLRTLSGAMHNMLGFDLGRLMGWFSFYDFMSASRSFYRVFGDEDFPVFILFVAGFIFIFSVACMLTLALYVYGLIRKWCNAQRIGKTAFLLTFIFAVLVFASVFLLNMTASYVLAEFGLIFGSTIIQLRWIFYAMAALAGIGLFFGFEKNERSYIRQLLRVQEHGPRYHLFKCSNCAQGLRVPHVKGKIKITCSKCGAMRYEIV